MLAEWLRHPQVERWWPGPDRQISLVREDLGDQAMQQLIALLGDQPLGYAQYYPAHHWPAPHFADLPADAIAIDVFGNPQTFGHGGAWLDALATLLLSQTTVLAIDPDPQNVRAIRAYQKAGFSGDEVRLDLEGHPARVMIRLR